ncbi:hypothetical protein D3C87_1743350 [compost metagenome]
MIGLDILVVNTRDSADVRNVLINCCTITGVVENIDLAGKCFVLTSLTLLVSGLIHFGRHVSLICLHVRDNSVEIVEIILRKAHAKMGFIRSIIKIERARYTLRALD